MNTRHADPLRLGSLALVLLISAGCAAGPSPSPSSVAGPTTDPGATAASPTPRPTTPATPTLPEPSEILPIPLRVGETGYTIFGDADSSFASYSAILINPNPDIVVRRMELHVDYRNANGDFVAGEEITVLVLPGQTTAISGQSYGVAGATSMEIVLPEDTTSYQAATGETGSFDVIDVVTTRSDGRTITTGSLRSRFTTEQSFIEIVTVNRDTTGKIVGGGNGGVQSIGPRATVQFEVIDESPYANVATTDVYWQLTR